MVGRKRVAAWNTWCEYAGHRKEAMRRLRGGLGRLMAREVAGALRRWRMCGDAIGVARRAMRQLMGMQHARALRAVCASAVPCVRVGTLTR